MYMHDLGERATSYLLRLYLYSAGTRVCLLSEYGRVHLGRCLIVVDTAFCELHLLLWRDTDEIVWEVHTGVH